MDDNEPLPWDYFLTDYERDLLRLTIDQVVLIYPRMNREQIRADALELRQSFGQENPPPIFRLQ